MLICGLCGRDFAQGEHATFITAPALGDELICDGCVASIQHGQRLPVLGRRQPEQGGTGFTDREVERACAES